MPKAQQAERCSSKTNICTQSAFRITLSWKQQSDYDQRLCSKSGFSSSVHAQNWVIIRTCIQVTLASTNKGTKPFHMAHGLITNTSLLSIPRAQTHKLGYHTFVHIIYKTVCRIQVKALSGDETRNVVYSLYGWLYPLCSELFIYNTQEVIFQFILHILTNTSSSLMVVMPPWG